MISLEAEIARRFITAWEWLQRHDRAQAAAIPVWPVYRFYWLTRRVPVDPPARWRLHFLGLASDIPAQPLTRAEHLGALRVFAIRDKASGEDVVTLETVLNADYQLQYRVLSYRHPGDLDALVPIINRVAARVAAQRTEET